MQAKSDAPARSARTLRTEWPRGHRRRPPKPKGEAVTRHNPRQPAPAARPVVFPHLDGSEVQRGARVTRDDARAVAPRHAYRGSATAAHGSAFPR